MEDRFAPHPGESSNVIAVLLFAWEEDDRSPGDGAAEKSASFSASSKRFSAKRRWIFSTMFENSATNFPDFLLDGVMMLLLLAPGLCC